MGRTLTGMLTGAAANFRHKFQHPSSGGYPDESPAGGSATSPSTPQHHYRQQRQQQLPQHRQASEGDLQAASAGGEQSSTSIPITVPGATYVDASKPQPYGIA